MQSAVMECRNARTVKSAVCSRPVFRHGWTVTCVFLVSVVLLAGRVGALEANSSMEPLHSHIVVTLSNGNIISGEVTAATPERIGIRSELLGAIEIPRTAAATIVVSQQPQTPELGTTDKLLQQQSVAPSSPQLQSAQPPAGQRSDPNKIYLAKFKIGASVLESTQKQQSYSGDLQIVKNWHSGERGWGHQRSLLLLSPTYDDKQSSKGANVTHNYNDIFQHILFTSNENLYVPVFLNFYSNNSLGIYFQQTYGAGIGRTFGALELDADLRFIGEHFYTPAKPALPSPSLGLAGAGLSERYDLPLSKIKPGAKFTEKVDFVPVFNASDAWQTHGIGEISIPFTNKISFVVSAFDNYMENAPAAFRKNYFKTTVGLQYSPK